jgi:hypothetical protein
MALTAAQQAGLYYARRRNRAERRMGVSMAPRGLTLPADTDTTSATHVAYVDSISDAGMGTNSISLSGPDADSFELSGRELLLAAGATLEAGTPLVVSVDVSNDVRGSASATFTLRVV